jgi:hypothetical protein
MAMAMSGRIAHEQAGDSATENKQPQRISDGVWSKKIGPKLGARGSICKTKFRV